MKDRIVSTLRCIASAQDDMKPMQAFEFAGDAALDMPYLATLNLVTIDEVSDVVLITTNGRAFAGLRPEGVPELPVEVEAVTGNIAESELAARYMEGKIKALDKAMATDAVRREFYGHVAVMLSEAANEFRAGLHVPAVHIDGRVEHYNDDRGTGLTHAGSLFLFFNDVYQRNVQAGWWTDIHNGGPKKRNVGELFMLMVTELAEAYEAYVNGTPDDKLPQYPGLGVEMGDLLIRIGDFLGALNAGNVIEYDPGSHNPGAAMFSEVCEIARRYEAIRKTPEARGDTEVAEFLPASDASIMVDAKLAFNATRADHKIENRLKEGGKET